MPESPRRVLIASASANHEGESSNPWHVSPLGETMPDTGPFIRSPVVRHRWPVLAHPPKLQLEPNLFQELNSLKPRVFQHPLSARRLSHLDTVGQWNLVKSRSATVPATQLSASSLKTFGLDILCNWDSTSRMVNCLYLHCNEKGYFFLFSRCFLGDYRGSQCERWSTLIVADASVCRSSAGQLLL